MEKPKNIKAAEELVKLYRNITIEQIKAEEQYLLNLNNSLPFKHIIHNLTGFGNENTCTLCKAVDYCISCIYGTDEVNTSCAKRENRLTYNDMLLAKSPETLLQALKNRADHIENLLKTFNQ